MQANLILRLSWNVERRGGLSRQMGILGNVLDRWVLVGERETAPPPFYNQHPQMGNTTELCNLLQSDKFCDRKFSGTLDGNARLAG
ncbi:hypothetical protein ACQ4M4_09315 [Leptolyngbya sp. AN02str]|uniref:hypothetical protein n=1 Tax=Leptolyngbya sp. AN02str TaxID=3423363 RepID=UPI003D319B5C